MEHRGRTIKRIVGEINALMQSCKTSKGHRIEGIGIIQPLHFLQADNITGRIRDFNEGYFFTSEPSVPIIQEYIDIVYQNIELLEDFYNLHHSEFSSATKDSLTSLIIELGELVKNLQEEMNSIQPAEPEIKIPTSALISLCKESEYGTKEDVAKELCDRFCGKKRKPGEVIDYWFQIGCNIKSQTDHPESFLKEILIENKLIESCGKDTIRQAIGRNT